MTERTMMMSSEGRRSSHPGATSESRTAETAAESGEETPETQATETILLPNRKTTPSRHATHRKEQSREKREKKQEQKENKEKAIEQQQRDFTLLFTSLTNQRRSMTNKNRRKQKSRSRHTQCVWVVVEKLALQKRYS